LPFASESEELEKPEEPEELEELEELEVLLEESEAAEAELELEAGAADGDDGAEELDASAGLGEGRGKFVLTRRAVTLQPDLRASHAWHTGHIWTVMTKACWQALGLRVAICSAIVWVCVAQVPSGLAL